MASVVAVVRILNAIQGRGTTSSVISSSSTRTALSEHVAFQRSARTARTVASVALAAGTGFFLGGLNKSSFVLRETGSAVSRKVGLKPSIKTHTCFGTRCFKIQRSYIFLSFVSSALYWRFVKSTYQKVELKEVPRSLDPRYRSSQE